MEIYLVRHTTPAVEKNLIYGRLNVSLRDSFKAEKNIILNKLPKKIDAVFSSPSKRCVMLASAITENFITDEDLYELNFGNWEGKTWDTINREESNFWAEDFVNRSPPFGESMIAMQTRVLSFFKRLLALNCQSVVVVTHAGVIKILLAEVENISLKDSFTFKVNYADVIRIVR